MSLTEQMTRLARQAKVASRALARLTTAEKNASLAAMAMTLERHGSALKSANARDLETGAQMGLTAALLDRLKLDDPRIAGMAQGLRDVAELADPVGRILDERTRPNGLRLQKVSTPIGVIVLIYESRPNVTADAAGLCFKSGNATILRGGKEALHSNQLIAQLMVDAARRALPKFPEHAIQVVPTPDRQAIPELLSLTQYIDLCMPRGGESLIRAVAELLAAHPDAAIATACHPITDVEEAFNPNVVKVVLDGRGYALYFSRATIPWARDAFAGGRDAVPEGLPLYRHYGLYAYRVRFLRVFPTLASAPIERFEALEQLRALWHGFRIVVAVTAGTPAPGVDTPEDLDRVRTLFAARKA